MPDRSPETRRWRVAGYALAGLLALLPVIRMALLVREGSALQYNDYWLLLEHYTTSDGGLDVGGLFDFEHQNHPVVVPMLAYWVNIQLFAGSNTALGLFVVVIALAMLALFAVVLRRGALRPSESMAVLVLASCLLFTPNGAWNYMMSMSGTAWLGAGLAGLVAVLLRSRDRSVLAFGATVLAAFTYATGLMVWPGVAAVGVCRRPLREWWREWPFAVGFLVNVAWYRQVQTMGLGADVPWPSPIEAVRTLARLLVLPLGLEGKIALYVGLVVLVALLLLIVAFAFIWRSPETAVWVGITVFGLAATMSLAIGRYETPLVVGPSSEVVWISGLAAQNRYSSVPAIALIGGSGLLVLGLRHHLGRMKRPLRPAVLWSPLGVIAVMAVLATSSGEEHTDWLRGLKPVQDLREVALRLDIADGTPYLMGVDLLSVTDLLVEAQHYPFVDEWDLDCGLIDEQLAPAAVAAEPSAGEILSSRRLGTLGGAPEVTGRIDSTRRVRCVVLADGDGRVVGAATLDVDVPGTGGDTGAVGFTGIARPGADVYRAYVVFAGTPDPVPIAEIRASDIDDGG